MTWKTTIVRYNPVTKLAESQLYDNFGRGLVGIFEIKINTVALKYRKDIAPIFATLNCNLLSSYEKNNEGTLSRQFSPLAIIKLSGTEGKLETISIKESLQFCDSSDIKIWLQDFDSKRISGIEFSVHCSYRKAKTNNAV